ncbi:MAG: PaaI family thioesterase, partial [Jiangellaceae bacterium]
SDGHATFALPAHGWLINEFGIVYGGLIAFVAKSAAAAAVQTVAGPGTTYTALDLKVNFLRPVNPDSTDIVASGTVLHRGRHLVISSSEVTHGGRTVAIATGTTALGSEESP